MNMLNFAIKNSGNLNLDMFGKHAVAGTLPTLLNVVHLSIPIINEESTLQNAMEYARKNWYKVFAWNNKIYIDDGMATPKATTWYIQDGEVHDLCDHVELKILKK